MDWLSIGTGITGIITGISGILFAQLSYRQAKRANSIAERALKEAAEANRIAVQANELAQDANAISDRAITLSKESFDYSWHFRIEGHQTVVVTNNSAYDALDFTLLAQAEKGGKPISTLTPFRCDADRLCFGGQIRFELERIYPQLADKARNSPRRIGSITGAQVTYSGRRPITFDVVIILKWETLAGKLCGDRIQKTLRYAQDNDGRFIVSILE